MLFISYWELSNDVSMAEIVEAGEMLMEEDMWPVEGLEVIRWDVTADDWGVTIVEADEYEAIANMIQVWEAVLPGIFEETKTAPATPSREAISGGRELLEAAPVQQ